MIDDYLWNKSGPPDPEVAELERLLGRFRLSTADAVPTSVSDPGPSLPPRFLAAAAVLVLACAASLWRPAGSSFAAWPVVRVSGVPTAGRTPVGEEARLSVGAWLETDASSRATLEVSTIGRLDVEPNTRLQLVETRQGTHRLAMAQGTVHAFIWAPPGQFVIDTPSSRAVDLGCAYTLDMEPDGTGTIEVTAGWVAFEHAGRESFIPAGARCTTRPGLGPGTPHMADAPVGLVDALSVLDSGESSAVDREQALAAILGMARPDDAVTLWHLLTRVPPAQRDRVFDALARHVPPPAEVTRDGIRRGSLTMRDAWWGALGLGDVDFWRAWKRGWR